MKMKTLLTVVCVAASLCAASPAAAQAYKLEKAAAPPPAALSTAVRETLSTEVLRVTGPKGLLCELWVRKSLPAAAAPSDEPDVKLARLAEGTLAGAMRLASDASDFRRQTIRAGVYTLRYAWIPVDGDHLGRAAQRDFLLLSPAAADTNPAGITRDELLELSRKSTTTKHPSVWSLALLEAGAGTLPAVVRNEDDNTWLLGFPATLAGGGSPVRMGLVVVGSAPEI